MRSAISRRDRRTLVIGCAIVAVLFIAARGLPTLRAWRTRHTASTGELRARLAFVNEARRSLPSMRDSIAARRRRLDSLNARVIHATTPTIAAAFLGALVERIADNSNLKVSSLELRLDTLARASTTRVTVRMSGEGDISGVGSFLATIDRHDEPMVVRELAVSQSDPLAPDDRAEVLHFDVRVEGLALLGDRVSAVDLSADMVAAPVFADSDPFRIANRPSQVRYGSASPAPIAGQLASMHDPRPTMTVRAIAGGPPWHALIDGMPGRTHLTLVAPGTTVDKLTVRRITLDSVVIRGTDTTWVLTFARRR